MISQIVSTANTGRNTHSVNFQYKSVNTATNATHMINTIDVIMPLNILYGNGLMENSATKSKVVFCIT